jgi:hypothetical protein
VPISDAKAASGQSVRFSLGGEVVNPAKTPFGGSTELIGFVAAVVVLWPARRLREWLRGRPRLRPGPVCARVPAR